MVMTEYANKKIEKATLLPSASSLTSLLSTRTPTWLRVPNPRKK